MTPTLNQNDRRRTTGVLLVNLGTPDSPSTSDVRKYLREFLMDPKVIDIPFWKRFLLVNGIIAPFRAPRSAKSYRAIWTPEGSPLLVHGQKVRNLLQIELERTDPEKFIVELAMRYQSPSIAAGLASLTQKGVDRILVVPLFPQEAGATTGSVQEKVSRECEKLKIGIEVHLVPAFYAEPGFIQALAQCANPQMKQSWDHVLFSYHGLPERQIRKADIGGTCLTSGCCACVTDKNQHCYRAQCYETSRLLAAALGIPKEGYTVCFQSRLGKEPWIQPYSSDAIHALAQQGVKRLLVFSPAFVCDCLETTFEIGEEYAEEFKALGGEELALVPGLNEEPLWVEFLGGLCRRHMA